MFLGLLLLVAIIVGVVLLAKRAGGSGVASAGAPVRYMGDDLARWVAAGLITDEQARAIYAHEQATRAATAAAARSSPVAAGAPTPPRPARPPRRVPVVAEALGYLGGTLALTGVVLLVASYWPDMATAGRLGLSGGAAAVLLVAGLFVPAESDPAFARLRGFVLLASTAATALFAGVLAADGYGTDAPETIVLACAAAVSVQSGILWWWRDRPLQQAVFLAGAIVTAGAAVAELAVTGVVGLVVWALGAVLVLGGLRRVTPQALLTEGIGVLSVIVGATMTAAQWQTFGLPFAAATASALIALAIVPGAAPATADQLLTGIAGVFTAFQVMPGLVGYYAGDAAVLTGLGVWLAGAGLYVVGTRRLVRAPVVVEVVGGLALVGGAAITGVQASAFAPVFGIVTAVGMLAVGMLPGQVLMSVFGALGLLINVPWAIGHFFPGEGRAPLLIMVSGALIVAVAVLLTRMGGRFRRELGSDRPGPGQLHGPTPA